MIEESPNVRDLVTFLLTRFVETGLELNGVRLWEDGVEIAGKEGDTLELAV